MKKVIFKDKICYIYDSRIKEKDRNKDFNYYELRHDDNDFGVPVTVENNVLINFWGTLATKDTIVLENEWTKGRFETNLSEEESWLLVKAASEDKLDTKINEKEEAYID